MEGKKHESRILLGLQESTNDGRGVNPPAVEKLHYEFVVAEDTKHYLGQGRDSLLFGLSGV